MFRGEICKWKLVMKMKRREDLFEPEGRDADAVVTVMYMWVDWSDIHISTAHCLFETQ
jgi:hypothetical protein